MKPKRVLSFITALVMTIFMLPTFTYAAVATTTTEKNITLGTSALKGGQQSNVYYGNYHQSSLGRSKPTTGTEDIDWITSTTATKNMQGPYYKIEPVKWRVLDTAFDYDGDAVNGEKDTTTSVLLLSDTNLDVVRYHETGGSVTWEESTIRSWLNGYDSDDFINSTFSSVEKSAIVNTYVKNDKNSTHDTPGGNATTDRIFLLSIAEVQNTAYGFTGNTSSTKTRKAVNTAYVFGGGSTGTGHMQEVGNVADNWWLRSPGSDADRVAIVCNDGGVDDDGGSVKISNCAIRPAFNLNQSSVLFTSAAYGGKSSTAAVGDEDAISKNADFSSFTDNDGYKLTVKDTNRSFDVSGEKNAKGDKGDTITFSYANAKIGNNEYISAMIVDSNGEVLYYGQIKSLADSNADKGTVSFKIPSNIDDGAYTLSLFNEQINGDYKTDFSSEFKTVSLTVKPIEEPSLQTAVSVDGETFTITPINITNGSTVILALYSDDELVEAQSAKYTGENITFTTGRTYTNTKAFVWSDLENCVPICKAKIVK